MLHYDGSGQMSLFEERVRFVKDGDMWKRFYQFHEIYPQVYEEFKERIQQKFSAKKKISSYVVRESIRLTEGVKFDNNFAPYYLRVFIEDYPQFKKFFRLRTLKKDL